MNQLIESMGSVLSDPALVYPAVLTLEVAALTFCFHLVLGLGLGWALAQPRWWGRTLLDIVVTVPLVFPPLALGFLLLLLLGRRGAIVAGLVLGTARSLGEVGITLMLGGNIVGKTNTMSLEVYNAVFNGEYPRAVVLSAILGALSVVIFIVLRRSSRPVLT